MRDRLYERREIKIIQKGEGGMHEEKQRKVKSMHTQCVRTIKVFLSSIH